MKIRSSCVTFFLCLVSLAHPAVADERVVYLVPAGYPESDSIHIVQDGDDPRFCNMGLEGLDHARTRLGYMPCSNLPANDTQPVPAERVDDVDALILVDDRQQLSAEALRVLSGAVGPMFGGEYVTPFGIELRNTGVATNVRASGVRALVVGERLYLEHYKDLPTSPLMWYASIDANIRSISEPHASLDITEIDTDAAARELYEQAVQSYYSGDFERAFWQFSNVARIPGLGRPVAAAMIAITIAAQGGDAYLNGDYQAAFYAWQRFRSHAMWLSEDVVMQLAEQQQHIYGLIHDHADVWAADALLRTGQEEMAVRLYPEETIALARELDTRAELLNSMLVLRQRHGDAVEELEEEWVADMQDVQDPVERANAEFLHGQDLLAQSRYEDAAWAFARAYAADAQPRFLYKTAETHEQNENFALAADYFARYLAAEPNAPDRSAIRRKIDLLHTRNLEQGELARVNSNEETAREHFRVGVELHDRGQYLEAVDQFKAAFRASPRRVLMFDIGQSYERAGQADSAIDYYTRYIEADPSADNVPDVRRRIADLQRQ